MEREIKIDYKSLKIILAVELIVFNILFVASLITLSVVCRVWYAYLICAVLFVALLVYSILVGLNRKKFDVYTLKEDGLYISNMAGEVKIDYADIIKITPLRSLVDRLTKQKSRTLIIYVNHPNMKRITIYFIDEDVLALTDEMFARASGKKEIKR